MCAVRLRSSRPLSLSRVPGARKAGFPDHIEPCDPALRERPPTGAGWLYEIKADGYRAQLRVHETTVFSRTGLDWTKQFSSIANAAAALNAGSAVIDGEAAVYGTKGLPDFQQLRRELGARKSQRVRYQAFDLLYLDGYDLRSTPYTTMTAVRSGSIANASGLASTVTRLAAGIIGHPPDALGMS
jgi:bifunctional non-homologous end joining protein LigD